MDSQNSVAYAESMYAAHQNQGGDYCQKRLSPRVQVMASGHQRTPGWGVTGELLVTDTILEPPLPSLKPGMVCFLRDFGQFVGQSHLSPPHSRPQGVYFP